MAPPSEPPPGSMTRLADFVVRRHRLILVATLLLTAAAGWRASKLKLKTDLAELLPEKDPAVVVMREMSGRIPGLSHIVIGVESPSPEANRRFVDELVPRIGVRKIPGVVEVDFGVQDERTFFKKNKFLYASVEQLENARDRLRHEIMKRKNPAFVDLSGDDQAGAKSLASRRAELEKKEHELLDKYPDAYFATKDRLKYAVVVRLEGSFFSEHHGEEVAAALRRVINEMGPTRYHPHMEVGLTGDTMIAIAERKALEDDLVLATAVCVFLVFLVISLFYGRVRAVPFATFPALCGVVLAFAYAQLAFGYLNASTAFMASIIVGNGINYAIIQMARYEEERRLGRGVRDAIAVALGATWRGTAIASLGAAIAYGSLAVTNFRGFNQFGYIGGVGMLLSWGLTILALPAAWVLLDKRRPEETMPTIQGFRFAAPVAQFTARHPKLLLALGVSLTIAAIVPLPRYVRDPFEYDFRRLGNQASRRHGGASALSGRLDPIFGRSLQPSFVIADDPSQVEEIREQLRERDKRHKVLGDVWTINDFVPGTPAVQKGKLEILAQIRTLVDKNAQLLDEAEKADAERLRPPDDLEVIQPRDLPLAVRRYFTEVDGTIGRPVAYYARQGITVWDGRTQIKLAAVTQEVRLKDQRTVRSSGKPAIFAGMINSITRDGPKATAVALLGVALLVVVLTFRRGGSILTLGVLVAGVLWMVGAAAYANVRVNFLNFIALPITFGIGVDYGVNIYLRYSLEGRGGAQRAVEATGAAVALASATTIIGYAALLVADNQALRSFGSMAILGEFACLCAALVIMPAVLMVRDRAVVRPAPPPQESPRSDAEPGASKGDGNGKGAHPPTLLSGLTDRQPPPPAPWGDPRAPRP
jgi:uncharacterized protein